MGLDPHLESKATAERLARLARTYGQLQAFYVHFDVQPLRELGVCPSVVVITKGGPPRIRELLLEKFGLAGGAPGDEMIHTMALDGLYRIQDIPLHEEGVY